jgi:hypothetical protein
MSPQAFRATVVVAALDIFAAAGVVWAWGLMAR